MENFGSFKTGFIKFRFKKNPENYRKTWINSKPLRNFFGMVLEKIRKIFGKSFENLSKILPEKYRKTWIISIIPGKFLENSWKIPGKSSENPRKISEKLRSIPQDSRVLNLKRLYLLLLALNISVFGRVRPCRRRLLAAHRFAFRCGLLLLFLLRLRFFFAAVSIIYWGGIYYDCLLWLKTKIRYLYL